MKNLQLHGKKVTADQMLGDLRSWVEAGGKLADRELELLKLIEHLSTRCRMLTGAVDKAHRRIYELVYIGEGMTVEQAKRTAAEFSNYTDGGGRRNADDCSKAGDPGAHSG